MTETVATVASVCRHVRSKNAGPFWITLDLSGDLPATMVEDLVGNSYDRVIAAMPASRRPLA